MLSQTQKCLNEWEAVFTPRPYWTTAAHQDPDRIGAFKLLMMCQSRDWLIRRTEAIAFHAAPPFGTPGQMSLQQCQLRAVADCRRGGADLKDHTWSAYRHLRKRYPRGAIKGHARGAPPCYVHAHSGTVVTAGNVEPRTMLKFMLEGGLQRFGIVGHVEYTDDREGLRQRPPRPALKPMLQMTWVEFTVEGLSALEDYYECQDRAMAATVVKAMKGLEGLLPRRGLQ